MIDFIKGRIVSIENDGLVIEIGNIGIKIITPKDLVQNCRIGDEAKFITHLYVREDIITLYGFSSGEQKDCFCLLLKVGGIGPRIALSILSTLPIQSFRSAVMNSQVDLLSAVQGVGKKTASKIILFLQDKISMRGTIENLTVENSLDYEVLQVLTNLGYSILEGQAAVQAIHKDVPQELDIRIQAALQYFVR